MKKGKTLDAKHPVIKKKVEDSLELSIKEGSVASVSLSLGESYIALFP